MFEDYNNEEHLSHNDKLGIIVFTKELFCETETETFSLNEKRIHFKNFLKNNWGKLPQQQEQRPKIKIL